MNQREFKNRSHTAWRISSRAAVVIRPSAPGSRLTAPKKACRIVNCLRFKLRVLGKKIAKSDHKIFRKQGTQNRFQKMGGNIRFGCEQLSWKTCLSAAGDRSLAVAAATLASTTA